MVNLKLYSFRNTITLFHRKADFPVVYFIKKGLILFK